MAEGRDAKGRFLPGHGFSKGRPEGSRNRALIELDELAGQHAKAVLARLLVLANAGDTASAKLILDRVWPARRGGRPVDFPLPTVKTADDAVAACAEILRGVSDGRLTADEGDALARIVDAQRAAIEHRDLERRLCELEDRESERRRHAAG